ncbi:Potassium channel AKT2/3 [Hibiscus syriacus]|uniref:Potassium channel n=1 Tax=Hibiscus syriacus TaxID=106335 RepID=A0A6A2ZG68_HIBSY|nr:Potassium channel AKT2/3 [Hibiscus syriacus]
MAFIAIDGVALGPVNKGSSRNFDGASWQRRSDVERLEVETASRVLPLDSVCKAEEVDVSLDYLRRISSLSTRSRTSSNFNLMFPDELLTAVTVTFQLSGRDDKSIKARTSSSNSISTFSYILERAAIRPVLVFSFAMLKATFWDNVSRITPRACLSRRAQSSFFMPSGCFPERVGCFEFAFEFVAALNFNTQHIATSKGHEECVLVLLKHACNVRLRDMNDNTTLWDAISSKHHSIFRSLYHCASISDPFTTSDLLCTATKPNDLTVMQELLKQGLNADAKDRSGLTTLQVALKEKHNQMKREIGQQITGTDSVSPLTKLAVGNPRVSIYRGHPLIRKESHCMEPGKLMNFADLESFSVNSVSVSQLAKTTPPGLQKMEMKASLESLKSFSRPRAEGAQPQKEGNESLDEDAYLSLSDLSKIILPPLGSSTYNHSNQTNSRWIISPMDSRYRCWETFMVMLVYHLAFVYPFEIAFLTPVPPVALYVADTVANSFFAVDIVLTFLVAYIDSTTQLLVLDREKIAKRYLSTWFIMDLASTIPFEALIRLLFTKSKLGLSYSCLELLRFWRLRRVKEFFTRLEKDIRFSYFIVRCAKLLSVSARGRTWIGTVNPHFRETSLWFRYISALYWSITTMTTIIGNMTNLVVEGTRRTMEFRDSIESAPNFVSRNRLPSRLREQILAYMCLRFQAESLNQQHLIEQFPKSIYTSICQHLFLPTVEKVYLFTGVSRETLLHLASKMKAEYVPQREDMMMPNDAPDDVYIIVSGEVKIIECEMEKGEVIVGILCSGDMFGETGALCSRPHRYTFRTKTLCQILKLKTADLIQAMEAKHKDNVAILKNFLWHHKRLKDITNGSSKMEGREEDGDPRNMSISLLDVAYTGIAAFLDELLKARLDPNKGDCKGRTPLHIAAPKGHEECVLVLLRHACNVHLRDMNGNTALWDALSSKHHSIFRILYHCASISDPFTTGDLLCTASKRNDLTVMQELLKQGLDLDAKDRSGLTALQVATKEKHNQMVNLLVTNGADIINANIYELSTSTLDEMLQKREIGHQITGTDSVSFLSKLGAGNPRVRIYKSHPLIRKESSCMEPGKLIRVPDSLDELKNLAGQKLGIDARIATVTDEAGAKIESIELIRDNDKLHVFENTILGS